MGRRLPCSTLLTGPYTLRPAAAAAARSLSCEQLAGIQRELLRRLDDSSNAVRIAACAALRSYLPLMAAAPPPLPQEAPAQLATVLLVHMDDQDPAVQEAACGALEALAASRVPGAAGGVRERAAVLVGVHRGRSYLDRLLAACGANCGLA